MRNPALNIFSFMFAIIFLFSGGAAGLFNYFDLKSSLAKGSELQSCQQDAEDYRRSDPSAYSFAESVQGPYVERCVKVIRTKVKEAAIKSLANFIGGFLTATVVALITMFVCIRHKKISIILPKSIAQSGGDFIREFAEQLALDPPMLIRNVRFSEGKDQVFNIVYTPRLLLADYSLKLAVRDGKLLVVGETAAINMIHKNLKKFLASTVRGKAAA